MPATRTPALVLQDASIAFAGIRVLHNVTLRAEPGEIRALVGKNGSGKTTLIKILSGFNRPDPSTRLWLAGQELSLPADPDALRAAGLAFVHQDLGLIPEATVLDNLLVGRFQARALALINLRAERARATEALDRFGLHVDLQAPVKNLSAVEKALIAITRGFLDTKERGGLIVLDEPTAFLPEADVARLFAAIRSMAEHGTAVIYVSHRLDEVLTLAHSVTVLRDGRVVHEGTTAGLSEEALVGHILGVGLDRFYPDPAPPSTGISLRIEGLTGPGLRPFTASFRKGEIVGLTGLGGAGHEDLPYLAFGAKPATGGILTLGEHRLAHDELDPLSARKAGIAFLPADRQRDSGAQGASLGENVTLPVLDRFLPATLRKGLLSSLAPIQRSVETAAATSLLRRFGVQPPEPARPLRTLSGGNQQKALLGKWVQTGPSVLLVHEPTQGVDVGSKQDIFRRLEESASQGVTVIIASAEVEDLVRLCHRIIVFRRGQAVGEFTAPGLNEEAIHDLAFRDTAPNRSLQDVG